MNPTSYGFHLTWADTPSYSGEILIVKEGEQTTFYYHKHRDKTLYILQGVVQLILENKTKMIGEGESYRIKPKLMHQIRALKDDATILVAGTELTNDEVEVKK